MSRRTWVYLSAIFMSATAAAETVVEMHRVDTKGVSGPLGRITVSESPHGLIFTPALEGLPPGLHGFHVHQNPSCEPQLKEGKPVAAGAAGDHYDPKATKQHDAPWGKGHMGDVPPLYVDANGKAELPVLAPRLTLKDLAGKSLMIHAGGDNFADQPKPLGGGGDRIACGVIAAAKQPAP